MYASLVSWEVTNFMSISHGVCEFDDSNMINIKGYNDSGKSAMLRALDILFYNKYPRDQVSFIKDGCSYFRVVAKFSDGVIVLRDKYVNGQSLYEMYKDNEVIFSTKVNNTLTKVSEVPEPIQAYLGVLQELNTRSCYDKQFAVQTSGSENYKLFSKILKAEELASASTMLNNDRNTLSSDISSTVNQINAYTEVMQDGGSLTDELVSSAENHDKFVDFYSVLRDYMQSCADVKSDLDSIVIHPLVRELSMDRLNSIVSARVLIDELGDLEIAPNVTILDTDRYSVLSDVSRGYSELNSMRVSPRVSEIEFSRYESILALKGISVKERDISPFVGDIDISRLLDLVSIKNTLSTMPDLSSIDNELESIDNELSSIKVQLGDTVVICPECGNIIEEVH